MANGTLKFNGAIKLGQLASAPADPAAGLLYYDTGLGEFRFYNGSTFTEVADFTQLGATGGSSGASRVGTGTSWTYISPASNDVESVLESIDAFLGTVSGTTPLDNAFRIENASDTTKKIAFDASGITTGTTRTLKMADANVDLANLTNSNISASAAIAYSKLNLSGSIVNADINASAAIAYSKLNLSASIVNADIASGAAIALSKLAALGTNLALQSNGSGVISVSAVTSTELGYVSGVTSAIQTQLNATEKTANKGANNGYASLDSGGKVPLSQLPATVLEYLGTWDASTNTPTLADGTGVSGQFYITQVAGTQDLGSGPQVFIVGDWVMYDGSIWERVVNSNSVVSVNGQTGAVTLTTSDISEGSNLYFTDDRAEDSVGGILANSSKVSLTYVSNTSITADIVAGSLVNADISSSAAIAYSKLALTGSIVNADINASAAIAYSKLALTGSIVNADINASAAIAYSKLALSNSIVNADINSSAAIAYSKLNLSGSILNADINASAAIAYSKLAALTASRALQTNASTGFIEVSSVTNTELGYVSGVTSSIQTQLNGKLSSVSQDTAPTLGGNLSLGGYSLISPFQIADASDNTKFFTEKYIASTSLTASTTAVASAFTFDSRNFKGVQLFYSILSGTSRRIGRIDVICDAASGSASSNVDLTDLSNETADVGVTWSAAVNGNNIELSYTTNSGTKTMRALMRMIQA